MEHLIPPTHTKRKGMHLYLELDKKKSVLRPNHDPVCTVWLLIVFAWRERGGERRRKGGGDQLNELYK